MDKRTWYTCLQYAIDAPPAITLSSRKGRNASCEITSYRSRMNLRGDCSLRQVEVPKLADIAWRARRHLHAREHLIQQAEQLHKANLATSTPKRGITTAGPGTTARVLRVDLGQELLRRSPCVLYDAEAENGVSDAG